MGEERNPASGNTRDLFASSDGRTVDGSPQRMSPEARFVSEFETLKRLIVRPAFENVAGVLRERGHEIHISEEKSGKIAIHIIPAGAIRSIHPFDWFPTFSIFGAPFTGSIGMHGRNARRNSEPAAGTRGDYKLGQLNQAIVEKALMKFVGEIANW